MVGDCIRTTGISGKYGCSEPPEPSVWEVDGFLSFSYTVHKGDRTPVSRVDVMK